MQLVTRHRRRDRAGGGGAAGRPAPDDERRAQRAERAGRAGAGDRQETGIPMAVGEELECMRTEIVRAGLALDHEAAIDLLTFSMAAQLVGRGFRGSDALDINASEGQRRPYKHRGAAA